MLWHKTIGAGGISKGIEVIAAFTHNAGNVTNPSAPLTGYGLQADDLIWACVTSKDDANNDITITSSGYTETHDAYANDTHDTQACAGYKIADGTETSVDFNIVANLATARIHVVIARGVNTTTPTDGYASASTFTNGATQVQPDITTSNDNCLIILMAAASGSTTDTTDVYTAPTGTENFSTQGFNTHRSAKATYFATSSGTQSTPNFGGGLNGDTETSGICITAAFQPAQDRL